MTERPRALPHLRRTATAVLLAATAAVGLTGGPAEARPVPGDRFLAGSVYNGQFPDPSVMRVRGRWVAAATTIANLNLPLMTSRDLRTWAPRKPLRHAGQWSSWRMYNEAMVRPPAWAATRGQRERVRLISLWAPSLARVGDHYVAAYSAAETLSPRHSCIGIARSRHALGPYRDRSDKPLTCYRPSDLGAIDPDVLVDPRTGKPWLVWKNEGVHQTHPPRLMVRRLDLAGTRWNHGSRGRVLVARDQAWEGSVVENPSMVRFAGRYYLFYSGNAWATRRYAVGYAVCARPTGPCTKPSSGPLLTTGDGIAGPGGADAFLDGRGRLRLAYAAWQSGRVGPSGGHERFLHVARLAANPDGTLRVVRRG